MKSLKDERIKLGKSAEGKVYYGYTEEDVTEFLEAKRKELKEKLCDFEGRLVHLHQTSGFSFENVIEELKKMEKVLSQEGGK